MCVQREGLEFAKGAMCAKRVVSMGATRRGELKTHMLREVTGFTKGVECARIADCASTAGTTGTAGSDGNAGTVVRSSNEKCAKREGREARN